MKYIGLTVFTILCAPLIVNYIVTMLLIAKALGH